MLGGQDLANATLPVEAIYDPNALTDPQKSFDNNHDDGPNGIRLNCKTRGLQKFIFHTILSQFHLVGSNISMEPCHFHSFVWYSRYSIVVRCHLIRVANDHVPLHIWMHAAFQYHLEPHNTNIRGDSVALSRVLFWQSSAVSEINAKLMYTGNTPPRNPTDNRNQRRFPWRETP